MVSYPLIKEGQLSHEYAITSSVEPMNLLSKGSNESLPKYRSTIWRNGLVPPCSILLPLFDVNHLKIANCSNLTSLLLFGQFWASIVYEIVP